MAPYLRQLSTACEFLAEGNRTCRLESLRLRTTAGCTRFAGGLAAATALLCSMSACTSQLLSRGTARPIEQPPVVDRTNVSGAVIAGYLENMQKLVLSAPAEQAEVVAAAQREFEIAPTPSHQLRYALILATTGHTASDLPRAQRLLRELMAAPAALLPAERALAFLEQQKVDAQLALTAENKRLQGIRGPQRQRPQHCREQTAAGGDR